MAVSANRFETQVKKISFALGAVADGSYLWAGADKGIVAEIEGKDVGDTIYYRINNIGEVSDVTGLRSGSGDSDVDFTTDTEAQLAQIKQRVVPVTLKDINVMYTVSAWERMCTSVGEAQAGADVGGKLMQKAVDYVMGQDLPTINNIFVGDSYKVFQLCGAFLKSYQKGKLYAFMDWQAWGDLTSKGQQAVPCNLARPEFGNQLEGKWSLFDELRTIPDIPMYDCGNSSVVTATCSAIDSTKTKVTVTLKGKASSDTIGGGDHYFVELPLKQINTADKKTQRNVVVDCKCSGAASTQATVEVNLPEWVKFIASADTVAANTACTMVATEAATYAGTIVRCDKAQVFGCANDVKVEGGKYTKSSVDGVTIHMNEDGDVKKLNTFKRYDLVFAGKLAEPRAAALVLYKI